MKKNNIIADNYTQSKITLRNVFRVIEFYQKLSKHEVESLNVSFVGDDEMVKMNQKHLSHIGSTDIITFNYSDSDEQNDSKIDGEIIICVDEAKRQSKFYQVPLIEELNRLIFHGLLHLTGFDDVKPKDSKIMKNREDEVLRLWNQYNLKK